MYILYIKSDVKIHAVSDILDVCQQKIPAVSDILDVFQQKMQTYDPELSFISAQRPTQFKRLHSSNSTDTRLE